MMMMMMMAPRPAAPSWENHSPTSPPRLVVTGITAGGPPIDDFSDNNSNSNSNSSNSNNSSSNQHNSNDEEGPVVVAATTPWLLSPSQQHPRVMARLLSECASVEQVWELLERYTDSTRPVSPPTATTTTAAAASPKTLGTTTSNTTTITTASTTTTTTADPSLRPAVIFATPASEQVYCKAMEVCSRHLDHAAAAVQIWRHWIPSSSLGRARAVSLLAASAATHKPPTSPTKANNNNTTKTTTTPTNSSLDPHPKVALLYEALDLLALDPPLSTSGPYNAAIAACAATQQWEAALCLLQDMPAHLVTTVTLNAVLTVLSKARRGQEAWDLLHNPRLVVVAEENNKNEDKNQNDNDPATNQPIDDDDDKPAMVAANTTTPPILPASSMSSLSSQSTNSAQQQQHPSSLSSRQTPPPCRVQPDRVSYHHALGALLGARQMERSCALVREMRASANPKTNPNQETFQRLAAAVRGSGKHFGETQETADYYKELVRQVVRDCDTTSHNNDNATTTTATATDATPRNKSSRQGASTTTDAAQWQPYVTEFQHWTTLPKVGRGKGAYWQVGCIRLGKGQGVVNGNNNNYSSSRADEENNYADDVLLVGLQPNRNPGANGLKLTFYRQSSSASTPSTKLGYLLMINSARDRSSQFLGQFVREQERGRGWAKVWLAVWLRLCLDAGLRPHTGKIHKPLLCLVLGHTFGMKPHTQGGIECELSPSMDPNDQPGHVVLYSSSRALQGVFAPLDLRRQKIRLSPVPTEPRGRSIVVGTTFEGPDELAQLEVRVQSVLSYHVWEPLPQVQDGTNLTTVLLGQ